MIFPIFQNMHMRKRMHLGTLHPGTHHFTTNNGGSLVGSKTCATLLFLSSSLLNIKLLHISKAIYHFWLVSIYMQKYTSDSRASWKNFERTCRRPQASFEPKPSRFHLSNSRNGKCSRNLMEKSSSLSMS